MCMGSPKIPPPKDPPPPPPPPPPLPNETAKSLTVGDKRASASIKNFLANAIGARKSKSSLSIPLGGTDAAGGSGLNIPG
mgnify:CR=1